MDLYERALKIQQSVGNSNWVLLPGELHLVFCALHALGKYVEGRGLDTCLVELGVYSSATLRQIFNVKAYKRGLEYHLTSALACLYLKFEAVLENHPGQLKDQCQTFKTALHERDEKLQTIFDELKGLYVEKLVPFMAKIGKTRDLASFLDCYISQVESLLHLITCARSGDWEGYLAVSENQIKYLFAHDLLHYARMMPVHISEMKKLKTEDPLTWEALKNGGFTVKKSGIPFTNLFSDQNLEQHIKVLKGSGGLCCLTQTPVALDRMLLVAPHLARFVKSFADSLPSNCSNSTKEHYQLKGDVAVRSTSNTLQLKESIIAHCQGNPYTTSTPLKSIVSSLVVSDEAKTDILQRDQKGQTEFHKFVKERLFKGYEVSMWDPMKKMKLRTFSTWMTKKRVHVSEQVYKLREERNLLQRILLIQRSRSHSLPPLEKIIGDFELAVVTRSMFSPDGSLLIPTDKSSIMHALENIKHVCANDEDDPTACVGANAGDNILENSTKVMIIDAMGVVQNMKKTPGMKRMLDFRDAFVKRIRQMSNSYQETCVIFDQYLENSLKSKTRAKRAVSEVAASNHFIIHDDMVVAKISLKELLSSNKTKESLAEYLAQALLDEFSQSEMKFVVVYSNQARAALPHFVSDTMKYHEHEEADTLIPLHVLDSIAECTTRDIHVWSSDTDALLLLMDIASRHHLGAMTKLTFVTGKGAKHWCVDVLGRVSALGQAKSQGLLGFHNFTGADWGGKFVGISKKPWTDTYLKLSDDDPIIMTFNQLGSTLNLKELLVDGDKYPDIVSALERFVCSVYNTGGLN